MMKFKFYFFKENSRSYDKAELFEFFNSNEDITLDLDGSEKKAIFYNKDTNTTADIIIGEKSVVPNLHRLNPKYLDMDIRMEIELLSPTYKLDKVLNVVEVMCKRYQFFVYNETFEDVRPYKRSTMIKAFELIKQAYKEKNEEEFMRYSRLERSSLDHVYQYIDNTPNLIEAHKDEGVIPLSYDFYKKPGSRQAYVAVTWDGETPFIIPSNAELFIYDDKITKRIISFQEVYNKINKLLIPVDNINAYAIYRINPKHLKKIKKIISKGKFTPIQVKLVNVKLDNILDL